MGQKSEGLGDSIDKFTSKTGIKKIVSLVVGEDCVGCLSRQDRLNELFPYKKNPPKDLTIDEYEWLKQYFDDNKAFSRVVIKAKIGTIYARIFNLHYKKICDCNGGRQLLRYTNELKKLFDIYKPITEE